MMPKMNSKHALLAQKAIVVMYLIAYSVYTLLIGGFEDFFQGHRFFVSLSWLVLLLYGFVFWSCAKTSYGFDVVSLITPLTFLFVVVLFTGANSGSTLMLYEVPFAIIISCIFSIRFVLPDAIIKKMSFFIQVTLLATQVAMVFLVHSIIPAIPD